MANDLGRSYFEAILETWGPFSNDYRIIPFECEDQSQPRDYTVLLKSGMLVHGLLLCQTNDTIIIKDKKAIQRTINKGEIKEMKKQDVSLMPADLQKMMSIQHVAEFLMTLEKAAPSTQKPAPK